jgi:hypothetical protein
LRSSYKNVSYKICPVNPHKNTRKPKGKRPLGNRHRWKHDIKMDLEEIECESVDWIQLA